MGPCFGIFLIKRSPRRHHQKENPPVRVAYISTCASARVKYFFVACVYYFQGCHCKNHGCEKGRTPKNNHWANSGLSVFFWVLWSDSFRTIPVLVNVVTWRLKREKRQRKLLPLTSALKKWGEIENITTRPQNNNTNNENGPNVFCWL